tara:strand:- start:46677 stop:46808 length:132 start_codon:yes stop_codon:yes gene_type:complete
MFVAAYSLTLAIKRLEKDIVKVVGEGISMGTSHGIIKGLFFNK